MRSTRKEYCRSQISSTPRMGTAVAPKTISALEIAGVTRGLCVCLVVPIPSCKTKNFTIWHRNKSILILSPKPPRLADGLEILLGAQVMHEHPRSKV